MDLNLRNRDATHSRNILRPSLRTVTILLAAIQTALGRNGMGPDSRSYSEIARAYLRHDWAMTINAYWSPLYSWLIALTLRLGRPSLRGEYPLLHWMNFCIFLVAIGAFEFFWSGLLASAARDAARRHENTASLPDFALWVLGYALFAWMTLGALLVPLSPDLCVATIALFAAGLLVRIRGDVLASRRGLYICLGFTLGIGYLTKAIMFPMAFVFFGIVFCMRRDWRNATNAALALFVFAVIAAPQVIILSKAKGRLTFGDSGRMALAASNYDLSLRNWEGYPPGGGTPVHSTRLVYSHPQIFEFNGPIRASYPPWYDPSYWNEGMSPELRIDVIARHFLRNATVILRDFTQPKIWLLGIVFLLIICAPGATVRGVFQYWYLMAPAFCIFVAYSLTFAEYRYMPAWLLMVWATLLAGIRLRAIFARPALVNSIAVIVASGILVSLAHGMYGQTKSVRHDDVSPQYEIAEGLVRLGLQRGDRVASIGFDNDVHWAYLDGLMVVAEIPMADVCDFWRVLPSAKSDILQKFAQAGAKAIIVNAAHSFENTSYNTPMNFAECSHPDSGWRKIGETEDYVYFLDKPN